MRFTVHRRSFLTSLAATGVTAKLFAQQDTNWGGPVLDTHLHLRASGDACYTHMQGCGVTHAVLLTPAAAQERAKTAMEKYPGHFVRSVATNPTQPESAGILRDALKAGGVSIGEVEVSVALDSAAL